MNDVKKFTLIKLLNKAINSEMNFVEKKELVTIVKEAKGTELEKSLKSVDYLFDVLSDEELRKLLARINTVLINSL